MDKLTVIKKAQELGGDERRTVIEQLMRAAHKMGCDSEVGGGRMGGINFRYGSIRYAIMDVNVEGEVKLYVQPHPNKAPPEQVAERLNRYIRESDGLEVKSYPLTCYGHLEGKIEDLPADALKGYLSEVISVIRETYYR